MKLQLTEKENCPRCGVAFECGKGGKCWCFEVEMPASILDKINDEYQGCLCPDCLKDITLKGKLLQNKQFGNTSSKVNYPATTDYSFRKLLILPTS